MALNENPTLKEIVDEAERLNNLIVNRGGSQTITPKTSNQTLAKGYYKGDITIKGDSNLVASNILSGKSIFGVAGSATVDSLGGKKWASGTATIHDKYYITVTGLAFTPSLIIIHTEPSSSVLRKYSIWDNMIYKNNAIEYAFSSWPPASTSASLARRTVGTSTASEYYVTSNSFKLNASNDNGHNGKTATWFAFE